MKNYWNVLVLLTLGACHTPDDASRGSTLAGPSVGAAQSAIAVVAPPPPPDPPAIEKCDGDVYVAGDGTRTDCTSLEVCATGLGYCGRQEGGIGCNCPKIDCYCRCMEGTVELVTADPRFVGEVKSQLECDALEESWNDRVDPACNGFTRAQVDSEILIPRHYGRYECKMEKK